LTKLAGNCCGGKYLRKKSFGYGDRSKRAEPKIKLTELDVFVLIPLIKMQIKKLHPVKEQCVAHKMCNTIRCSKNPFASLKIFKPKAREIQRMV